LLQRNHPGAHRFEEMSGTEVPVISLNPLGSPVQCDSRRGREKFMVSDATAPAKNWPKDPGDVTILLQDWRNGDQSALERLTPIIYSDLLRLAKTRLNREYGDCTLEPTGLVHESYLRLADQTKLDCENRAHFYAIAANVMRRVLIDDAKRRKAQKRGGDVRITLKTGVDSADEQAPDCLMLDEALRKLADIDERKSRAIELKFFGGMTAEEIGQVLGISVATVGRELRLGQAWLRRELSRSST
jgi:RNA polymerase sigma factor (TIGR02999 family)